MATKNYLSVNKKINIKTKNGETYRLSKPKDFDRRILRSGSGELIFASCRALRLKIGEPLMVVAGGVSWPFWMSPSDIVSIEEIKTQKYFMYCINRRKKEISIQWLQ